MADSRQFKEQLNLIKKLNDATRERAKSEKQLDDSFLDREKILSKIVANTDNENKLLKTQVDIEKKINNYKDTGHGILADNLKVERQLTRIRLKEIKMKRIANGLTEAGDDLLGGMVTKFDELVSLAGKPGGLLVIGITAAAAVLKSFSDNLDKIGDQFGVIGVTEFSKDLMAADATMAKLGFEAGTAASMAEKLSNEFGIGFKEAANLTPKIADLSKALGISTDEGATLVGQLTKITGLSTESAIQFAKQTELLAKSAGVAPGAVMEDIAGSSEIGV